eukprot:CAMPEP_0117442654 /NCGR_PEP_ID=MMETSP0759-20121206/4268_1 /TAXON_ID=63605 /ORGANISM="Percolomonas cosmopolitus, Strain WS" /LENGTH=702 /DNA_ID=CAMNT_0005234559 /DNA_START=283 /DNA_END=2391 /DNA_ORIENTATION=+
MQSLVSISHTIQNEISHWYGTLVHSTSSQAYSFLQNVPYLSEVANHTEISKKEPVCTFSVLHNSHSPQASQAIAGALAGTQTPASQMHSRQSSGELSSLDPLPSSHIPPTEQHARTNSATVMLSWHSFYNSLDHESFHDEITLGDLIPHPRVGFHILSQDVVYLILQYLDCRSLLNVSLISSWYYHMTHEDIFWQQWLHIEESRVAFLRQQQDNQNDLSTNADYTLVEPHQLQLLHIFYKPSKEEEIYARFQNFSIMNPTTTFDTTSLSPDELSELQDDAASMMQLDEDNLGPHISISDLQQMELSPQNDGLDSQHEPYYSPDPTEEEILRQHYERIYSSYLNFRKIKLRNPFIRSKLIRIYTHDLKKRYEMLTKWINHGKLTAATFLTLGTVSLSLQLDQIIEWWWAFVFLPLIIFASLCAALNIVLWMPTIQWPISLYRWVAKEYVGSWTSWAYMMTKQARWVQLFCGIWMPCTVFVAFAHMTFSSFIPKWAIFAWMGIGCLIWGFTPTQFLDPRTRRSYSIILFLLDICLVLFCVLVVLKLALIDQLLQPFPLIDFYWTIPFAPLFCALGLCLVFEFKMSFDLNRFGSARMPCACVCWNGLFVVVYSLLLLFVTMLWVKLEMTHTRAIPVLVRSGMSQFYYFYIFIPLELLEIMAIVYYALRCYTNKVDQNILKFPFQMAGGKWTNAGSLGHEYEKYVV